MGNKKKTSILFMLCLLSMQNFAYVKADENENVLRFNDNQTSDIETENQEFENFYPGNPMSREFYKGYNRDGDFILRKKNGMIYSASAINVVWEGKGTVQYYKVNGQFIKKESGDTSREINVYPTQKFILKKDLSLAYSNPFEESVINGKTIKSGIYLSTRSSVDFVEIQLEDGTKVWVNPQYTPNYEVQNNGYFLESKEYLSVNNIEGIPLNKMIMPYSESKRTGYPMKVSYVTIHNTANTDKGADAYKHALLQLNESYSEVSWHFTVDDHQVYQSIPMNEVAWHAGDGLGNGNGASIGIEICENDDGNYSKAEENAAMLTARILVENNLTVNDVKMHKDWSGKVCPSNIINGEKGSRGWTGFVGLVKSEYDKISTPKWNKKANGEWEYLVNNSPVNGWQSINGLQYYFKNYEMVHDWFLDENTQTWYFFNGGVMQRSDITINNITYLFDSDGIWRGYQPKWIWENNNYYYRDRWNNNVIGWQAIEGLQYKFREDGTMIRDWYLDEKTQTWYFFNGGVMQRTNMMINEKLNLFDNDGIWRGIKEV